MEPSVFSYYKSLLSVARMDSEAIREINWGEKRTEGSLLVFKPNHVEPETRLIQTKYPQWYSSDTIGKEDQIIHVLPITGAITHGGAECSYGTREMADRFLYADNQECVIGHLVLLDTPGGSATANDLDMVFANAKKPTVALIRGMNASKGVWISSFIPHVFAERDDIEVGCIGAMAHMQGKKNGIDRNNEVSYEVYAENSVFKNIEYREAIQNGNLEPIMKMLNQFESDFRETVKKRWPNVPDDKLQGRMYRASEVKGELIDGIKSYSQAVNYIFELVGVSRNNPGLITTMGVIGTADDDDNTGDVNPYEKKKRTSCQAATEQSSETIPSASGTEEPVQIENTNPQTLIIPMANKEQLEAIPGMGSVAMDEAGNANLTAAQYDVLSEHLAKGNAAMKLANTQQETISGLQQVVAKKDGEIKELAEATGAPIAQPVVEGDPAPATASKTVDGPICSGNLSNLEADIKAMKSVMANFGLLKE